MRCVAFLFVLAAVALAGAGCCCLGPLDIGHAPLQAGAAPGLASVAAADRAHLDDATEMTPQRF